MRHDAFPYQKLLQVKWHVKSKYFKIDATWKLESLAGKKRWDFWITGAMVFNCLRMFEQFSAAFWCSNEAVTEHGGRWHGTALNPCNTGRTSLVHKCQRRVLTLVLPWHVCSVQHGNCFINCNCFSKARFQTIDKGLLKPQAIGWNSSISRHGDSWRANGASRLSASHGTFGGSMLGCMRARLDSHQALSVPSACEQKSVPFSSNLGKMVGTLRLRSSIHKILGKVFAAILLRMPIQHYLSTGTPWHALTWIWQGHASTNHSMIFLWVSGIKGIGTPSGEKKLVVVVVQESGRSGRSGSD